MENNYYQQPVQAPQPAKKLNVKLGKQHIFMAISIFLGSAIIPLITGLISSLFLSLITSVSASYYYDYSTTFYGYAVSDIINAFSGVFAAAVYVLFAYLVYKNIRGAACFVGIVFVSKAAASLLTGIIQAVVDLIIALVLNGNSYSSDYAAATGARSIIIYVLMFVGAIIAAVIGVILLMIVEKGKLNFKSKKAAAPVQPQQTV